MFAIQSNIAWFFIFIHVSNCERRIHEGSQVKAEKPYVVYLVKAPISNIGYDYWLCGGALVTSEFVVTSAACIKDVDYMYVIAGYNKYVTNENIEFDPCTSKMKKKVIYTCYPEGYDLKYERIDRWSLIDIGVAKVESPYDFSDQTYKSICSYIPGTIPINFEGKYQEPGIDAIVLGWGHKLKWRKPEDKENYNQKNLHYASVMLIDKKECKKEYTEHGRMTEVIDNYMICTDGSGSIDDFGIPVSDRQIVLQDGCSQRKSLAFNPDAALEDCEYDDEDETRRTNIKKSSNVSMIENKTKNKVNNTTAETNITTVSNKADLSENIAAFNRRTDSINGFTMTNRTALTSRTFSSNRTVSTQNPFFYNKTHDFNENFSDTRRYGICQNDHGGPLVTWIGSHETLIGVASVFKVTKDFECEGPFLYTSTQCNGAFLDCILAKSDFNAIDDDDDDLRRSSHTVTDNRSRRSFCRKSSDDERHPTTEKHISWLYHPAGAADHERHLIRGRDEPGVNKQAPERNEENINKNRMRINIVNKMIPANERYPPIEHNQKSSVNYVNNAPNEKYIVSENITPNYYQRGAPNNKHVANNPYPSRHIPGIINNKYSSNNGPTTNNGPAQANGPALNSGPASNNGPAQANGPALNNGPASNNGPAQANGPAPNNGPASNNGPAQVNGPALNNEPASNNGPAQPNGPAIDHGPAINYKSERINDHGLRNGPVLIEKSERNNNHAPINWPALQYNKPATNRSPKLKVIKKPLMRPTLPLRI